MKANQFTALAANGPLFHEAVKEFKTMITTRYQKKKQARQKDLDAGSYRYDCVGFVSYALKQAAPQAWDSTFKARSIKTGIKKGIPKPQWYREFFASLSKKPQRGWVSVAKASELLPGDVVAWEQQTKSASGHAVVIGSAPELGAGGTWLVEVYDSTSSPHCDDSRPSDHRAELASTGRPSGLGHGVMAFVADPVSGALTGFRWCPKAKTITVPIAAGRPTS